MTIGAIIYPLLPQQNTLLAPDERMNEAVSLANAVDIEVLYTNVKSIKQPKASTLFGQGQIDEIKASITPHKVEVVVIDGVISPLQQRNLEKAWNTKVIDRTGLILEIFAIRAQTHEGRLQVNLARLEYEKSRLVKTWTHLERQRGGFGMMGGPGERQLEIDRRLINDQIKKIKKNLKKVIKTRELQRHKRTKAPYPTIALAGYTNAGKSTLFNQLSKAKVFAKDQLFATLDPTMRMLSFNSQQQAILSDTVGFISDLPTELIAAFRATLEEVIHATIVVLVEDISSPQANAQRKTVETILQDLGYQGTIIRAWNKIDQLDQSEHQKLQRYVERSTTPTVLISAQENIGLDALIETFKTHTFPDDFHVELCVLYDQSSMMEYCLKNRSLQKVRNTENHSVFQFLFSRKTYAQFMDLVLSIQ